MATQTGNSGSVTVDATVIGEVKSFTLEQSAEQIDDTALGDSARTSKSGLPSATGQIECWFDEADAGQIDLTIGSEVELVLYPKGNTSGEPTRTLTAQVTGISESVAIDEILAVTFQYAMSTGTVVLGTVA